MWLYYIYKARFLQTFYTVILQSPNYYSKDLKLKKALASIDASNNNLYFCLIHLSVVDPTSLLPRAHYVPCVVAVSRCPSRGPSRGPSRNNSLNPSRAPSRAHSRAASPIIVNPGSDDATLPLMLCSLLQREFSGPKAGNTLRPSGSRKFRKGEEENEEEEGQFSIAPLCLSSLFCPLSVSQSTPHKQPATPSIERLIPLSSTFP